MSTPPSSSPEEATPSPAPEGSTANPQRSWREKNTDTSNRGLVNHPQFRSTRDGKLQRLNLNLCMKKLN